MGMTTPQTYRPTRYPGLLYARFSTTLWRFIDADGNKPVGPHYRTKGELFADMERYAAQWGCVQPLLLPEHEAHLVGFKTPVKAVWTIQEVKEALPRVLVQDSGTTYTRYLAGRNKRYPTVYYSAISGTRAKNEWSWQAIVRSLNTKTALQA